MKRILIIACIAFGMLAHAQVDRSKAPAPAKAPTIQIPDAETFELENGLKVILVENHKRPVVSFQLSVDYTPFLEGDVAGNASIAGQLLRTGTASRSKSEIDESVDFIGATFSTSSSGMYASTLTKHVDKLLTVVSDVLLNPTFPQQELDKVKKQTISGLQANKEDASAISANVTSVLRYGKDHPFGEVETEETVEAITKETCENFYKTYYRPNVSYLVIVGDVNKTRAQELAKKYFGKWEKGDVPSATLPTPKKPEGTQVCFVPKTGAVQSVISITYPVQLKTGDEDLIRARVMNNILGGGIFSGRLMQNLREDKGYTYGARSSISPNKYVGSFSAGASVRNEVTDSSITEFLFEMDRMAKMPVEDNDLSLTKNSMNGAFARSLESPQTIARFALNTIRYNLPKDYYRNYLTNLSAVSIADVQTTAKKYITPKNAYVVVVGNKDVAEKLARFDSDGEITFLNYYGDEAELVEMKPAPEGVSAQDVLDKYVLAFTESADMKSAQKKIKKLKAVSTKAKTSIQGYDLDVEIFRKAPNMFAQHISMMGNVMQKQKFNGTKGKSISQMGAEEMEGEDLEKMKVEATLVAESKYNDLGLSVELIGVEPVGGKDAYVLKVSKGEDELSMDYYDVESGLKVKSVSTQETPQGAVTVVNVSKDYKSVNGYQFPFTMEQSGAMSLTMEVESVEVNAKLSDDLFN